MTSVDQTPPITPTNPPPAPPHPARGPQVAPGKVRLGEELPIFCERCGYQLHGLPQIRCEHCSILQFHCPECGHHQPINTLRPAAQKFLGRIRAGWLAISVFFRLNFFGWLLFAWYISGLELFYPYAWRTPRTPFYPETALIIAFVIFAFLFAAVGRMMLLRWRNGPLVGLVLAAAVAMAFLAGATYAQGLYFVAFSSSTPGLLVLLAWTVTAAVLGAIVAWPIWVAAVRLFLPHHIAEALLDWQRSFSEKLPSLARQ